MAIYRCMSKPISQIYDVFQKTRLSPEDKSTCMLAIRKLKASEMICIMTTTVLSTPDRECIYRLVRCSYSCSELLHNHFTMIANADGADPLAMTNEILKAKLDLCTKCPQSLKNHALQRVKQWNAIPDMFQCPSWEDLVMMKEKTLGLNPSPRPDLDNYLLDYLSD